MNIKYSKFYKKGADESGVVLMFVAFSMLVMVGMMGLVFDLGQAYFMKRKMQSAADAAAFAGAHVIKSLIVNEGEGPYTEADITADAIAEAARNGYDISESNVLYPPQSGYHAGDNHYVEVIIRDAHPTWFMQILDKDQSDVNVAARAIAGARPQSDFCIYVLNGSEDSAFKANSDSHIHAPKCGIKVSSCDKQKAMEVSSDSTVEAASVAVCGGVEDGGGTIIPDPDTGVDSGACGVPECSKGKDPLKLLPPVSASDPCDHNDQVEVKGVMELEPGVYCGGIKVNEGTANFQPGIYVLRGGGLEVNGGSAIGTGVTFYNTEGGGHDFKPFVINSTGTTVDLSAPEGGTMKDVLLFMDKNINPGAFQETNIIDSKVSATLNGIIYLPTGFLKVNSESNVEMALGKIVVDTLEFNSKGNLYVGTDGSAGGETPMKVTLVE